MFYASLNEGAKCNLTTLIFIYFYYLFHYAKWEHEVLYAFSLKDVHISYHHPIYRDIALKYQLRQVKPICKIKSTEAENKIRPATIKSTSCSLFNVDCSRKLWYQSSEIYRFTHTNYMTRTHLEFMFKLLYWRLFFFFSFTNNILCFGHLLKILLLDSLDASPQRNIISLQRFTTAAQHTLMHPNSLYTIHNTC